MTTDQVNHVKGMEKAGKLAARTLTHVSQFAKIGISTDELNKIAHDFILSHSAIPAPLNYHGFPKSICTSVNDVICHGVPDGTKLKSGDIINIDVTTIVDGYHGDTSQTLLIGDVKQSVRDLVDCALKAMEKGIEAIQPGSTTGDIGFAINKYSTKNGFYPVKEIGGHGIGKIFHDSPFVPSFGKKGKGERLEAWKCITVEPMLNQTNCDMKEFSIPQSTIKWYKTACGCFSAQFEHTVLITDKGYEIMTVF